MTRSAIRLFITLAFALVSATALFAQAPPPSQDDDDDAVLNPAQPDFTLVSLPTALRLPRFKSALRITHRFGLPLNRGDFGNIASNLFGIDTGATIGLEFRIGIVPHGEIGVHHSSDNRTWAFFGQYGIVR